MIVLMLLALMNTSDIKDNFDFQYLRSHAKPTKGQIAKTNYNKTLISIVLDVPTISVRAKLFCRNLYSLVVLPSGKVRGSYNSTVVRNYGK